MAHFPPELVAHSSPEWVAHLHRNTHLPIFTEPYKTRSEQKFYIFDDLVLSFRGVNLQPLVGPTHVVRYLNRVQSREPTFLIVDVFVRCLFDRWLQD